MNTFPKFTPLGGCYNYTKLKKEGLVENPDESDEIEQSKLGVVTCFIDDTRVDCDTWEEPEFTPENDPYGGY
jgi:hypothetical protein